MTAGDVDAQRCCGWLVRWADDPSVPIEFDADLNEYQLVTRGPGEAYSKIPFYFCPSCGHTAPKSRRESLFEPLTEGEMDRLSELARGLRSLEDVRGRFGDPDDEHIEDLKRMAHLLGSGPVASSQRTWKYFRLSATLDVIFIDTGIEPVKMLMGGKFRSRGQRQEPAI